MTMMLDRNPTLAPATADADRGQAAFTRTGLALYDLLVLRGLCTWVWRCPNKRILAAYRQHLSNNHLEVGVGTGYFLDHARFSDAAPRVASHATTRRFIGPMCCNRSCSMCAASTPSR